MPNANNYPLFVQNQRTGVAVLGTLATAITSNTPTNTALAAVIGSNGGVLTRASVMPLGTVTAHVVYLFYSKDAGATKILFAAVTVPLYSASTSTAQPETSFSFSEDAPKRFAAGDQIYAGVSSTQAAGSILNLDWGDF